MILVCMVGDFSANLDEGYKNTSHYLAQVLEKRHRVLRLNTKRVRSGEFWRGIAAITPDIIHTIAQPTDQSLILTHALGQVFPRARTVVSALRSDRYFPNGGITPKQRFLFRVARPNLVLEQTGRG